MTKRPFTLIGELINNSFSRAASAFQKRSIEKYQALARLQTERRADFLTVNIDGTQRLRVTQQEMLDFLPELVPALQEATSLPLSFDNPAVEFHRKALPLYKRNENNRPILNSLAASRQRLDEMIELVAEFDTLVVLMVSEKFISTGGAQCMAAQEVYETTKRFVDILRKRANRSNEQIIVDPGLAPVSADTYGIVNMGLDAMRLIRKDPDLAGIHISVGLTNFSFGVPNNIKTGLENAYITLALTEGLDFVLGNPEKNLHLLDANDIHLKVVREALELGRPLAGETQEQAGYRQAEKIMDLFHADSA